MRRTDRKEGRRRRLSRKVPCPAEERQKARNTHPALLSKAKHKIFNPAEQQGSGEWRPAGPCARERVGCGLGRETHQPWSREAAGQGEPAALRITTGMHHGSCGGCRCFWPRHSHFAVVQQHAVHLLDGPVCSILCLKVHKCIALGAILVAHHLQGDLTGLRDT